MVFLRELSPLLLQESTTRESGSEGPQGSAAIGRELAAKITEWVWEATARPGALEILAHRMPGLRVTNEKRRGNAIER